MIERRRKKKDKKMWTEIFTVVDSKMKVMCIITVSIILNWHFAAVLSEGKP